VSYVPKDAGSSPAKTAVLVDEHPLWLEAVEQVLHRVSIQVTGRGTSFAEGTELIQRLQPDLVVAEISTFDSTTSGLSWLSDIRQQFPDIKVIVLSMSDDPAQINAALSAGAVAFVVKKAHPDDLAVAVRQAYEHSIFLPGWTSEREPVFADRPDHPDLTRRELEILRLVAEGHSNADVAKMLWVTEQTVKFHLSNIYRKLAVGNRTEASRWAQVHGLLSAKSGH
jgi:DNA-binding NarL/FixJ family response regulator